MIKAALNESNALVKSETAPRMIGQIILFGAESAPAHCLACDGSAISRTTYAALFAAIGTTWGAGDGSSTFNLPDLRNEWVQGAGTNAVGADIAEGLPNITGRLGFEVNGLFVVATGCFVGTPQTSNRSVDYDGKVGTVAPYANVVFTPSQSSAIYGASDHVTPKSKALKACIIYE